MNMPLDAFLTGLYVIVDDWFKTHGQRLLAHKVGKKPVFSDSEVMTLSIAQHWCGFRDERKWLRFIEHNFRPMFPNLLSQSEFNRRARNLCWLVREMRAWVLKQMNAFSEEYRIIDSTPVHIRHWRRFAKTSLWMPGAALGYCAAKKSAFYGYRLVTVCTLDGVITDWELTPANASEREAALDLLLDYRNVTTFADKGFADRKREEALKERTGNRLLAIRRSNQHQQNPPALDRLIRSVRAHIETVYDQAKEFFSLESPGAKTLWGLASRLIAKTTGLTIAAWINRLKGRPALTLAGFSF